MLTWITCLYFGISPIRLPTAQATVHHGMSTEGERSSSLVFGLTPSMALPCPLLPKCLSLLSVPIPALQRNSSLTDTCQPTIWRLFTHTEPPRSVVKVPDVVGGWENCLVADANAHILHMNVPWCDVVWTLVDERSVVSHLYLSLPTASQVGNTGSGRRPTGSCVAAVTGRWLSNVNFNDVFICILTEWKTLHCVELYNVSYVYTEHFIQWVNFLINHCYHCVGCI